ncbi:MAG: Very short patch repair protein [Firmicutes bacterium]|nr:Very short patch repair protein [Bacillota bacterium]
MKKEVDESRSKIMARVKSKGNKSTELKFIDALRAWSISGWRCRIDVLGKPDFVFSKEKIAMFIDGCFWHGCSKHCRLPATNVQYWVDKIQGNIRRDKQVTKELKKRGWIVFRFWEHELTGGASLSRKLNRMKEIVVASRATSCRRRKMNGNSIN